MPETPVYEHSDLLSREDDVGPYGALTALQAQIATVAGVGRVQQSADCKLGLHAFPTIGLHVPATRISFGSTLLG